ncbi:Maf family nucleotide pyrophosphatase [Uruburuella testudinis]|uniref:7-methyl-GTP pyrophosphatase n=1 Tax=Uruburuella testudinis TaxID=1282863 RepID=A0ABY4DUI8_9NEIS|nr:nucleoside triphosphate pyrophosphatase [Uruburuella testudinis]UOO82523.1 Maf family nucleotide pyrophosphatase [Uruburuella testudinis]
MNTKLPLILGSSSVFRQQQLRTLGLIFEIAKPDFDETARTGESAADTALRLAVGKAQSLAAAFPQALIIGADQVAWCNGQQLGKPMSVANAQHMLAALSGKTLTFYSALCLLNTASGRLHTHTDTTTVTMRALSSRQISRYLEREPDAIYCAGAAKSEGLGAALLQRIDSSDPNALIGLPIFKLVDFLQAEGMPVL